MRKPGKPRIHLNQLQKQSTMYVYYGNVCFYCKCVLALTVVIKALLVSLGQE